MSVRPEHRRREHRVRPEWGPAAAALLAAECAPGLRDGFLRDGARRG